MRVVPMVGSSVVAGTAAAKEEGKLAAEPATVARVITTKERVPQRLNRLAVKSKGAEKPVRGRRGKAGKDPVKGSKGKAAKPKTIGDLFARRNPGPDPNMPRRPHCAFYIFLEEFRRQFNEQNSREMLFTDMPNFEMSKAAGRRWKALGKEGQATYEADAKQRLREYEKAMAAYNGESPPTSEEEEEDKEESDNDDNEHKDDDE